MPDALPLISIVDDDVSVARALRRVIQYAGYPVETFASARAFLDSPHVGRTACLVLDIRLDGPSGLELAERLAADHAAIPIIFITAHDDPPTRARVARVGAAGYLLKPIDKQVLLGAISRALDGGS